MKKIYFTVGPSQIFPSLRKHINSALKSDIPSLNHRGSEFKLLFKNTSDNLKKLLNIPKDYQIFFVSSALESMERVIESCVEKVSFHVITGYFGKAWANYAAKFGKIALTSKQLESKIPKDAELVCVTQNDTSTGFWIPVEEIYKLKGKNPEKLVAIDIVSSVPYVDLAYQYIDVAFFSVQKGFGLPAGLGVIIVSPKALEKCESLIRKDINVGGYHNLKNLSEKARDFQTPETPNVLNIYLLDKVIKDMLKIGISKIRKDTEIKANLMYDFFENHKRYQPFIKNPHFRSQTTLVFDVKGESEVLRKKLAKKGFIVGAGYGENKLNHIRIANFPSHKLNDVKLMLKHI